MKMLRKKMKTALTLSLLVLLSATAPRLLLAQEPNGGEVWQRNCNRCHQYRDIKERTDKQWKVITQHMRVRANLSGKEARAVLQFMQKLN